MNPIKTYEVSAPYRRGRHRPLVIIPGDSYGGYTLEVRNINALQSPNHKRALKRAAKAALRRALAQPGAQTITIEVR